MCLDFFDFECLLRELEAIGRNYATTTALDCVQETALPTRIIIHLQIALPPRPPEPFPHPESLTVSAFAQPHPRPYGRALLSAPASPVPDPPRRLFWEGSIGESRGGGQIPSRSVRVRLPTSVRGGSKQLRLLAWMR